MYLTPDKQTGLQERGRHSFVPLPYAPRMQYLCLFFLSSFTVLSCCCNRISVFLGFVSDLVRHRCSKVMCQQCNIVFAPHVLLLLCNLGRSCHFLKATFPVSNAATVHRLGNCAQQIWGCYKGFGDRARSRNFFFTPRDYVEDCFECFSQSFVNVLCSE